MKKIGYNQDDIRQLIRQGENHAVEFKSSQVHPDSLAKEMTAFANSYGGASCRLKDEQR